MSFVCRRFGSSLKRRRFGQLRSDEHDENSERRIRKLLHRDRKFAAVKRIGVPGVGQRTAENVWALQRLSLVISVYEAHDSRAHRATLAKIVRHSAETLTYLRFTSAPRMWAVGLAQCGILNRLRKVELGWDAHNAVLRILKLIPADVLQVLLIRRRQLRTSPWPELDWNEEAAEGVSEVARFTQLRHFESAQLLKLHDDVVRRCLEKLSFCFNSKQPHKNGLGAFRRLRSLLVSCQGADELGRLQLGDLPHLSTFVILLHSQVPSLDDFLRPLIPLSHLRCLKLGNIIAPGAAGHELALLHLFPNLEVLHLGVLCPVRVGPAATLRVAIPTQLRTLLVHAAQHTLQEQHNNPSATRLDDADRILLSAPPGVHLRRLSLQGLAAAFEGLSASFSAPTLDVLVLGDRRWESPGTKTPNLIAEFVCRRAASLVALAESKAELSAENASLLGLQHLFVLD